MIIGFALLTIKSMAQQVIASSGDSYKGPYGELSWTLGEGLIMTFDEGPDVLTQGIQQSELPSPLVAQEIDESQYEGYSVYPNPTTGLVNLVLEESQTYRVQVINSLGATVSQFEFQEKKHNLDLSPHPKGIYLIHVISTLGDISWITKIIKL